MEESATTIQFFTAFKVSESGQFLTNNHGTASQAGVQSTEFLMMYQNNACGGGVSGDFPLAYHWAMSRTLRLADGPDEVHRESVAKLELAKQRILRGGV